MDALYTNHPPFGNESPEEVSSAMSDSPPRRPRRQSGKSANASSSSKYALSGASVTNRLHAPRSKLRDNHAYQDHDSATGAAQLASILQLHRDAPWVGDTLNPVDTSRILRAYTSMAVAFAVCERMDGDRLSALLALALSRQDDRHPQAGIDDAAQAVLEALGKW
jgi:hypothetical protein